MNVAKMFKRWTAAAALALTLAAVPLARLAAQDAAAAPAPNAGAEAATGNAEKGKAVFETAMCGACHVLAAAEASGPIGPSLDNNPNLTHAFIVERVANGAGAMPPFAGQLSPEEIEDVTAYILSVAAK